MLITEKEFAEILNIKYNTLVCKRKRGDINFYIKTGRFYFYKKEDCLEFAKTHKLKHIVYDVDLNYFNKIDNQNKAYFLGLLYADGGNTGNSISLALHEQDKNILYSLQKELKTKKPIKNYQTKTTNYYVLNISHKKMIKDLESLGIIKQKSLKLDFPIIDDNLVRHFIRGYFDGDGGISINKNNHYSVSIKITSTNLFLTELKNIISSKLNIHCGIYNISSLRNDNDITKVFCISGWNQSKKFLNWIYDDSNLFIERKRNKFNELILIKDNN
jgi:hypothetical protein